MRVIFPAISCYLAIFTGGTLLAAQPPSDAPTFTRDIAPILYANCVQCHRSGEVAPFALLTYQDASTRADFLAEVVATGAMPPWRAAEGYGHFVAERRLTAQQKKMIAEWAAAGAPEGDPSDLPSVPTFPTGWTLGEPDIVLEAPHSIEVPAEGSDLFHHFIVPLGLPEDVEVTAVEFRPGNPKVVHHAVILLDESGLARERDQATPEPGYNTTGGLGIPLAAILNIWAPGVSTHHLPTDVSLHLPGKADVVVQLHLHPSGKAEQDRSKIGLYLAKKPAKRHILKRPFIFGPVTFDIPPGASRHKISASIEVPVDLTLTAVLPHMHMLGREMKVHANLPDGSTEELIWIPDWNFNWQDQYVYREPVYLPKGSVVVVEAVYDNSADNPFNPTSPPKRIRFGEETTDEMCLAIFQAVAEQPTDATAIRNALILNVIKQVSDPSVSPDTRKHIRDQLREFAGPELRGLLLDSLRGRLKEGSGGS